MNIRRNKKGILPDLIFSRFFLVFCIIIFFTILFGLAKNTIKNYQIKSEVDDLKEEIAMIEGQNKDFDQLIQFLNSDAYIEQEAKLKLGYKNPGENMVIIPNSKNSESIGDVEIEHDLTNPGKWWKYFFN